MSRKENINDEAAVSALTKLLLNSNNESNYTSYMDTTEYRWLLEELGETLQDPDPDPDDYFDFTNLTIPIEDYQPIWEFWVPGVLLPVVGILGLIGNTISIFILSRPQMKSSINCLLIGLATFDMILIATSILMFAIPSIYTHSLLSGDESFLSYYYEQIFPFITPVIFPVGLISQTGSVYLTICVTLERYLAVCHPLKAKYLCTYGRAKIYVLLTAVFSVGYNLPRFWEVTWSETWSPMLNRTITEVIPTSLRLNQIYIEVYINWLYLIFLYLTPITILTIFNIRIYREVRLAQSLRADLSRTQARELGLASMLLCVVMVFLLCNFPAMVVNILEHFGHQYHPLTQTNNLLVTINSSVNFIIYCIFGHKFKRIFITLICGAMSRGRNTQGTYLLQNFMINYVSVRKQINKS